MGIILRIFDNPGEDTVKVIYEKKEVFSISEKLLSNNKFLNAGFQVALKFYLENIKGKNNNDRKKF